MTCPVISILSIKKEQHRRCWPDRSPWELAIDPPDGLGWQAHPVFPGAGIADIYDNTSSLLHQAQWICLLSYKLKHALDFFRLRQVCLEKADPGSAGLNFGGGAVSINLRAMVMQASGVPLPGEPQGNGVAQPARCTGYQG